MPIIFTYLPLQTEISFQHSLTTWTSSTIQSPSLPSFLLFCNTSVSLALVCACMCANKSEQVADQKAEVGGNIAKAKQVRWSDVETYHAEACWFRLRCIPFSKATRFVRLVMSTSDPSFPAFLEHMLESSSGKCPNPHVVGAIEKEALQYVVSTNWPIFYLRFGVQFALVRLVASHTRHSNTFCPMPLLTRLHYQSHPITY